MRNICLTPTVAKPFHQQVNDNVKTIKLQKIWADYNDVRIFLKVTQKKTKKTKKPSPRIRKVG